MEKVILDYLIRTYTPHTIILYGSFQNHTNNKDSDFDALLITENAVRQYDGKVIQGIKLDVFIYSDSDFSDNLDIDKYIQVFDGRIIKDDKGIGEKLIDKVKKYTEQHSVISEQEKRHLKEWCYKMFARTQRGDTEGMFRWHWLLTDSLEIYCNMRDMFYFGPKKTLLWMQQNDKEGHLLIDQSLKATDLFALKHWIDYVVSPY